MSLIRREPELELERLADRMNRLFDGRSMLSGEREWALPVDLIEDEQKITIKASVPGVEADDLDVSIDDNTLTIKGKTESETEQKNENWHMRERRHGSCFRSISLPDRVDKEKASVSLKNGVLTIEAPLSEAPKGRKLAVKSAS